MANDAKNVAVAERGGPQQQTQQRPSEANPYSEPSAYLLGKGWKCLGHPDWQNSLWLDPTQPLVSRYDRKPIMVEKQVRQPYRDPKTGQEAYRYVTEQQQVMAQDGSGGAPVQAWQSVYVPKGVPVPMTQALQVQIERDAIEQQRRMADEERKRGAA